MLDNGKNLLKMKKRNVGITKCDFYEGRTHVPFWLNTGEKMRGNANHESRQQRFWN
ncbi:hypothetical protein SAMN02799616_04081 [Paenibacillus sp. UNC499MF]|nr:hypothetical protein SAMN02799616_04081 [Paenibacillus sp. UNC499MF]